MECGACFTKGKMSVELHYALIFLTGSVIRAVWEGLSSSGTAPSPGAHHLPSHVQCEVSPNLSDSDKAGMVGYCAL